MKMEPTWRLVATLLIGLVVSNTVLVMYVFYDLKELEELEPIYCSDPTTGPEKLIDRELTCEALKDYYAALCCDVDFSKLER
jgi:hypothetical protein